tara:strand:+ start:996 stop:1220 length:225 start_codon:yes stop_codon:yes gene_type:complete
MINFLNSVPLYPGWLFLFFFGLLFIKLTKYRKVGKAIIILFSIPILLIIASTFFGVWLMETNPGAFPGGEAYTP